MEKRTFDAKTFIIGENTTAISIPIETCQALNIKKGIIITITIEKIHYQEEKNTKQEYPGINMEQ